MSTIKDPLKKPEFKTIYLYLLIVALGFFFGNLAFTRILLPKISSTAKKIVPKQTKQDISTPIIKELPPAEATNTPTDLKPLEVNEPILTLNGIYFEKDSGYALINSRILKIGDIIDGARLKRVDLEGVELEFNGKQIRISNPS